MTRLLLLRFRHSSTGVRAQIARKYGLYGRENKWKYRTINFFRDFFSLSFRNRVGGSEIFVGGRGGGGQEGTRLSPGSLCQMSLIPFIAWLTGAEPLFSYYSVSRLFLIPYIITFSLSRNFLCPTYPILAIVFTLPSKWPWFKLHAQLRVPSIL